MFHVYWPLTAFITMVIVVGVIMAILRYGPKLCKTRHVTWADDHDWERETYEQKVSYA